MEISFIRITYFSIFEFRRRRAQRDLHYKMIMSDSSKHFEIIQTFELSLLKSR